MNDNQLNVIENRLAAFPGETWGQITDRVATKIAKAEHEQDYWKSQFKWVMDNMYFLPNSPTLRNFGANQGSGSACFVLPIEDNRKSIFMTLYHAVEVQASGGGTGFNFSELRPKGSLIKSTGGRSSGPVSFIGIYDKVVGDVISQGGVRKGANMGIMNCNHPDIFEFLDAKNEEGILSNFNLSVGIYDEFMNAVITNADWKLHHPASEKDICIKARDLWNKICEGAWNNGEPGLVFLDTINEDNMDELIVATNPCGEIPQPPYTSCVLGSLNLRVIPPELLERVTKIAVRMLDNIIDVNAYPIPEIEERTKHYRNIGLGVMGYADMLIKRNLKYGSKEALVATHELFIKINKYARAASNALMYLKGACGTTEKYRNTNLTSIAPTGTLSIIADCSAGCEPYFAFEYTKKCMDKTLTIKSSIVDEAFGAGEALVNAQEVPYEDHIATQAAIQEHIDAGISKTINIQNNATQSNIEDALMLAWKNKCKGITVYRDGSRSIEAQSVEKCPECKSVLVRSEGCFTCPDPSCGYSKCSI